MLKAIQGKSRLYGAHRPVICISISGKVNTSHKRLQSSMKHDFILILGLKSELFLMHLQRED